VTSDVAWIALSCCWYTRQFSDRYTRDFQCALGESDAFVHVELIYDMHHPFFSFILVIFLHLDQTILPAPHRNHKCLGTHTHILISLVTRVRLHTLPLPRTQHSSIMSLSSFRPGFKPSLMVILITPPTHITCHWNEWINTLKHLLVQFNLQ
jgi:hypothetical protein